MDAILRLHEKIMAEPLGGKRPRATQDQAAGVVAPGSVPSSYRFDKAKRAEWIEAMKEGREEQLRIRKWMEERARLASTPRKGDAGDRI